MLKDDQIRIYHGPVNVAGIGPILSFYENKQEGVSSEFISYETSRFHRFNEKSLELEKVWIVWRHLKPLFFFIRSLFKYDVYHFYFGKSFLFLSADLPILKLLGKKVVMTYCGSDIRLFNDVDLKRNPYAELIYVDEPKKLSLLKKIKRIFIFGYNRPEYDRRKIRMMKFQNRFVDKFVAIRDNYAYAEHVIPEEKIISDILINNISVGEPQKYETEDGGKVKVVHAPTNKAFKGSKYIENAINELIAEGLNIDYIRIENKSFEEATQLMKDADIVIDQIIIGGIGSVSIEAMSYGKPVIAYLMESVIEKHCPDIPIYNSTIETLKDNLKTLVNSKGLREELGQKGLEYIKKHYDHQTLAKEMIAVYKEL